MSKTILTLDISSSSVGGALVSVEKGGARMIFSHRVSIPFHKELDPERILSATLRSLDQLLQEIFQKRLSPPKHALCLLSSPWYVSEIRAISLQKEKPFPFTAKLADGLLKKEADALDPGDHLDPIEMKTLRTLLNGYHTSEPEGKKAKEVEMEVFISLAPKEFLKKVKESITRHFSVQVKFASFSFAAFAAARDIFPEEDFVIVEAGGEVTELASVKNGGYAGLASFPLGSNALLRNVPRSEFSTYMSGHAGKETVKRMKPAIDGYQREWLGHFEETLGRASGLVSVPPFVLLVAEDEFADLFTKMIGSESGNQYDWAREKFRVARLRKEMIENLYLSRFF